MDWGGWSGRRAKPQRVTIAADARADEQAGNGSEVAMTGGRAEGRLTKVRICCERI